MVIANNVSMFSECPSDKWELDEESDRCLWLSKTGLDYDSALEDCRRRGGHLTTPDKIENIEILEKSFGLKEEPVSFWAEYLLVLHGSRHRLFDGSGAEVELSSCGQCQSLLDQHSQVRNQSVTRVCAHVTRNTSTTWTTTDCQNEHSFVCYHSRSKLWISILLTENISDWCLTTRLRLFHLNDCGQHNDGRNRAINPKGETQDHVKA